MSEEEPISDGNRDSHQKPPWRSVVGEDDVAVLMRREGRQTVDNLNRGLGNIDRKASKLMRANIVLAGLLLSAFSFASKSQNIDTSPFINSFSICGIVVFVASILAAGITYTATDSQVGVSSRTIQKCISLDLEQTEVDRGLAKAYARWIEINRRANVKNAFFISLTVLLVLASVILLSTAVLVGAFGESLPIHLRLGVWLVALILIFGVGWIANVKKEYREWTDYS